MQTLTLYTRRANALDEFKTKNKTVLDKLTELEGGVEDARKAMTTEAKETGRGGANDQFEVTLITPERKWYDYGVLQKKAKPDELKAINEKAITITVDRVKMQKLVKTGQVSVETDRAAFSVTPMTPRLNIKRVEDAE